MPTETEAMRALENLTPGGSEYVGDIPRCVEHIRWRQSSQHERVVRLAKQLNEVRPKADAYDGVCKALGIEKDIIGHLRERDQLAWGLAEAVMGADQGDLEEADRANELARKLLALYKVKP